MGSQPTPEEAAEALREVAERRQQASSLASYPKWVLWVVGVLAVAVAVSSDLFPEFSTPLTYLIAVIALLLTFLPRWKRAGSAMGYAYSPDPRPVGMSARTRLLNMAVLIGAMILVVVVSPILRSSELPYSTTIFAVLSIATVVVWHRWRSRPPRGPKAVDHG